MKKIGLILFASLAMSVGAMAQMPNFDRSEMLKNMTNNQTERLKLNKEQAAKMLVLNDSLMSSMMGGFTPGADMGQMDFEAMRAKMEKAREKYNKGVKALLTADQYKEFEKMQEEQRQRMGQGGPGGFGGGPR
ncbi:MAG: hypothetical protein IKJ42_03710 [Bacteroidaceae bacterium]|nr:hypothetical protein [Bacteroidaceae bacterium]MBR3896114.1 hypothetical protein [Bacteroidaceae bacterium]